MTPADAHAHAFGHRTGVPVAGSDATATTTAGAGAIHAAYCAPRWTSKAAAAEWTTGVAVVDAVEKKSKARLATTGDGVGGAWKKQRGPAASVADATGAELSGGSCTKSGDQLGKGGASTAAAAANVVASATTSQPVLERMVIKFGNWQERVAQSERLSSPTTAAAKPTGTGTATTTAAATTATTAAVTTGTAAGITTTTATAEALAAATARAAAAAAASEKKLRRTREPTGKRNYEALASSSASSTGGGSSATTEGQSTTGSGSSMSRNSSSYIAAETTRSALAVEVQAQAVVRGGVHHLYSAPNGTERPLSVPLVDALGMWPCSSCSSMNQPQAEGCYNCEAARPQSPPVSPNRTAVGRAAVVASERGGAGAGPPPPPPPLPKPAPAPAGRTPRATRRKKNSGAGKSRTSRAARIKSPVAAAAATVAGTGGTVVAAAATLAPVPTRKKTTAAERARAAANTTVYRARCSLCKMLIRRNETECVVCESRNPEGARKGKTKKKENVVAQDWWCCDTCSIFNETEKCRTCRAPKPPSLLTDEELYDLEYRVGAAETAGTTGARAVGDVDVGPVPAPPHHDASVVGTPCLCGGASCAAGALNDDQCLGD